MGSLLPRLTAHLTARWWVVFAIVIVVPSVALSLVSLQLINRLAHDETATVVANAAAVPWYNEAKMNRALAARALHAARVVGLEALADPELSRARLRAAGLDLFSLLVVEAPTAGRGSSRPKVLFGRARSESVVLADAEGRQLGTLRYQYTAAGMGTVISEAYNQLKAPWNDDSVEIFFDGPAGSSYDAGFDLHLNVTARGGVLWERQGRTAQLRAASHVSPRGFSVELAVPWRHLGVEPREGAALRFDLTNDDDDDGGLRDGQRTWSGSSWNWVDPAQLGVLRLGCRAGRACKREVGKGEAVARRAIRPLVLDGRLSEPEWELPYRAEKTEGRTDNTVRFGALWTDEELSVGVEVEDPQPVDDDSREDLHWILRVITPDGRRLYDSSPLASSFFGDRQAFGVSHLVTTGALKGSRILVAFRERPMSRRVDRWKLGAVGLIGAIDVLLGIGLWLVYANTKRRMDFAALKSDFVATVSHEFKAPLALLRASAETLGGGRVLEKDKRERYLTIIERETRRLATLVDNVLAVSRIEAGRHFQLVPTDLAAVVDAALSLYRARLEEEGFTLELEVQRDLPLVLADAEALQEAVSNLIDNAMKYGLERRWCRIEARDAGPAVTIAVSDAGIGISPSEQERIFERFYRAGQSSLTAKGTGLGLSLARDILRAHGGEVQVRSQPGQGSTFTLVVPKAGRTT